MKNPFNTTTRTCTSLNSFRMAIGVCLAMLVSMVILLSCKKFITVDSLKDSLLTDQVYSNDASANSAILGIYATLKDTQVSTTINALSSMSGDDSAYQIPGASIDDFYKNTLKSTASLLPWTSEYSVIYQANAAIEGLQKSTGLNNEKKKQFLAEAKFMRAYAYFYLVNFFGDVPLLLSTDVAKNDLAARTSSTEIYSQIISDLLEAQAGLPADFSISPGSRTRINKMAVTAFLARVYLYQQKWSLAEQQATVVINSGLCSLLDSPIGIFNRNNQEAIFQLDRFNGEPLNLLDYFTAASPTSSPRSVCSTSLVAAFENNDLRKSNWLYPIVYLGQSFSTAYKFRVKSIAVASELETPLRLAEQYLIRAEAFAMQGNFSGAIADINLIRLKHGGLSTALPTPTNQQNAIDLIFHERRVELFTEGAHRWFDLKRTGKVNTVMQNEKPNTWTSKAEFYPIPLADVQRNPNLKQNTGY